jgi:hypothetical protein
MSGLMHKLINSKMSIVATTVTVLLYLLPHGTCAQVSVSSVQDTLNLSVQDTLNLSVQDTLSRKEAKALEKELRLKQRDKKKRERDSIKAVKDSIRWSKPRILETYILEDSLQYKRLIKWRHSSLFNSIEMLNPDTTFNENFYFYPFNREDIDATYLGVSGSAAKSINYFKRSYSPHFEQFEPYLIYSHTKDDVPFYNVKTPYTELAYWGTLFANRDKEESNIKIMHSQNLSPSFNFNFTYRRFGGNGLLAREITDNRTLTFTTNYLGKRYVMHSGYIYQGIKREENGGIVDDKMVLDTTLEDSKDLQYHLQSADNQLKRNTFFLTHSYGLPVRWSSKDTLAPGEGTVTYFGHTFEYTTYTKKYTDEIELSDIEGREFYNNIFLLSPTQTRDSVRTSILENKGFIRIQPWAKDAIISRLDAGIGHQLMSIYNFKPEEYIHGSSERKYNNTFVYFGAEGQLKKYILWNANAKYDLTGYYANNSSIDGKMRFSVYPVEGGIHLTGKVRISSRRPSWFSQSYYSNHYQWNNNFNNITETTLKGSLEIPGYKLKVDASYAVLNDPVYYGIQGYASQHKGNVSIFAASLQKNFKFGFLHLENRLLLQMSSNKEIIPLPEISANIRYYMQFELVKNVLTAQLGADVRYNTPYFAQAYNPALGIFHNQNEREIGNYPYLDAFVNLQWKRASIFVKYLNTTQGWPDGDYFSAHNYIRPETAIQFGMHWPFYVK